MKKVTFTRKTQKEIFEEQTYNQFYEILENFALDLNEKMQEKTSQDELKEQYAKNFEDLILKTANEAEFRCFCTKTEKMGQKKASEYYVKNFVKQVSLDFVKEKLAEDTLTNSDKYYSFAITKSTSFLMDVVSKTFEKENKKLRRKLEENFVEGKEKKEVVIPTPFAPELRGKF